MEFQLLSLTSGDQEDEFVVKCFGRTADDITVCLEIPYKPFFYIEVLPGVSMLKSSIMERTNADSIKKVKKEKFYGYQNYNLYDFYKLSFFTKSDWYNAQRILQYKSDLGQHTIYEGNVDPMLKLIHEKHIDTTGWIRVENYEIISSDYKVKKHIRANVKDVKKIDNNNIAKFVIASFDIESYSPDGSFPDPKNIECPVIQIATTFQRIGEENPFKKVLLSLKSCEQIEGVELHTFEDEKDLLNYWPKVLHENEYDCMTGYNIWGFDLWYMITRADILEADEFKQLGKTDEDSKLRETKFSSSAYGDNDYKMVSTPGVFQLDLLVVIKREHKLNSYKLDSVSEHFLGDKKVDLSPKEMFAKFRGTAADRRDIGVYCVKDTDLPLRLIWKLAIFLNMVEMAKVTKVPIGFLIERGQGIKVFSQLCYEAQEANMVIETFQKAKVSVDESAYEGATVLEAKKGAYMHEPITGLDFASLYPSIERAWNLCPTTLVVEPKYRKMEDETYVTIDGYKFAQKRQGIIPKLLERLALSRKKAKKDMANAENDFMKAVFNGKQLAFKVSMNSIYGAMGSPTFQIPCKPVAACTTSKGRQMIEQTKSLVEEYYPGAEVVYGDSVSGDTPLLLRQGNITEVKRIDELEGEWKNYQSDKLYYQPKEFIYVWNDSGFTEIKKVIKHKTTKRMYRILTHEGVVDVTEDHSLVNTQKEIIKPKDVTLDTELLHHCVPEFGNQDQISYHEAKVMGFFMGYGSCGRYETKWGVKYSWALNNQNIQYLKEMQSLAPFETKILNTIKSSKVYKLVASGDVKYITNRYRLMFYNQAREKIVPNEIINATKEIQRAFWEGYYMANGCKTENTIRCDANGKQGVFGLYIIAKRLGYNVSINDRSDKKNVFRLNLSKENKRKETNKIKKIIDLGIVEDFVYDLETENHHFHVGPGALVVHNTDSVMVKFPTTSVEESFKLGEEAAERISKTFPPPVELEFEKVYNPYLLFSKKRYAGLMYTKPEKPDYIDAKGIQVVRRDNCAMVRKILKETLDIIMFEKDITKARDLVKNKVIELEQYKINVNDLVVTKSLKRIKYNYSKDGLKVESEYKNPQPHVQVAENIERREKGTGPKSGERVPYVFIETGRPDDLQYQKAEDPQHVIDNDLKIDVTYYKERALMSPIESLFELFYDNPIEEIFIAVEKAKQADLMDFVTI